MDERAPGLEEALAAVLYSAALDAARAALARLGEPEGTLTECPIEGVHEHAFRGPHRFREWDPATFRPAEPEPGEDEAWEALASDLWGTEMTLTETIAIINDHRPRITAAIRSSAGLDVALTSQRTVEVVAEAMHAGRITGCAFTTNGQACSPRDHIPDATSYLNERRAALSEGKERGTEHG